MEAKRLLISLRQRGVISRQQCRVFPTGGCKLAHDVRSSESLGKQPVEFRHELGFAVPIRAQVLPHLPR
jgi:hypothetical protein